MTPTWKSFLTRTTSAVVALIVVIGLYWYLQVLGLKIIAAFAILVGTWELLTMLFKNEQSKFLKASFFISSLIVCATTAVTLNVGIILFALTCTLLWMFGLMALHQSGNPDRILNFQAKATLGLVYMGLIPSFVFRILDAQMGVAWFVYLLAVVFCGDTMAYIFGVLIGKHKVMPSVSPKKTWQGSIGGISGSVLAGFICWYFPLRNFDIRFILGLAASAGFVGQFGDFFESLLKRTADVKDSGRIMPGHGGVLDRIDGVLFAAPVVFVGIVIMSHLLS